MRITMFPMGVGESILLSDEGQHSNLLVDCGTQAKKDDVSRYVDNVRRKIESIHDSGSNASFDALLSHYHMDHYNKFEEVFENVSIDTLYIPDYFECAFSGVSAFDLTFLCCVIFEDIEIGRERLGALGHFFDWALHQNKVRKCVLLSRGQTFQTAGQEFIVLSPDFQNGRLTKSFGDVYREAKNAIASAIPDYAHIISNITNTSKELGTDIREAIISNEDNFNSNKITSFYQRLEDEYNKLRNHSTKAIYAKIRKKISEEIASKIKKSIKNKEDELSIVFQTNSVYENDSGPLNEKAILMTGDMTTKVMRDLVRNQDGKYPLLQYYYAFKAPHHGTESRDDLYQYVHFDYKHYLISNGSKDGRSNCGKISVKSAMRAIEHKALCLNKYPDRCSFVENFHVCCMSCFVHPNIDFLDCKCELVHRNVCCLTI